MFLILFHFLNPSSSATLIQILHTNDLHASIRSAGDPAENESENGGWGQVKTLMDSLTQEQKVKGIETIRLDAGDFTEGTLDYFPDYGSSVLKAFQAIGYDATALGNHDWLMGAQGLNTAYGRAPFPFPILSANVAISPHLENLKRMILPHTRIIRGKGESQVKIGVFGLSTNELYYRWITHVGSKFTDMRILNYEKKSVDEDESDLGIAEHEIKELRKDNDVVIALTHIGFDSDHRLAKSSSGLDLIVGGHSHTYLKSLATVNDRDGHEVPIVQTGVNGNYIGKIMLEVDKNKKPKVQVLTYELIRVPHSLPSHPDVQKFIDEAEEKVQDHYFAKNLDEVLGQSEVRLTAGAEGPTPWGKFIVDAMRWVTQADLAIDIGEFHGATPRAKGPVTLRTIMEMYPRKFEESQDEGLYIYEADVPGWLIPHLIKYSLNSPHYLEFSGVTFERITKKDQKFTIKKVRINDEEICQLCNYRIAVPESLIRGAYGISKSLSMLLKNGKPTVHTIWQAGARYLKKIKTIKAFQPLPRTEECAPLIQSETPTEE